MTFLVFSKLFTFTQIIQKHSNRSRKRNHQIEKLLVLHSHRYSFCFQGYIRMWWVGTVFAVHQPLHVHFRKAICAGPCGFCTMGGSTDRSYACSEPAAVFPQPHAGSRPGSHTVQKQHGCDGSDSTWTGHPALTSGANQGKACIPENEHRLLTRQNATFLFSFQKVSAPGFSYFSQWEHCCNFGYVNEAPERGIGALWAAAFVPQEQEDCL